MGISHRLGLRAARRVALVAAASCGVGLLAGLPAQADTEASPGFATVEGVVRIEKTSSGPRVALYATPHSATPVKAIPIQVSLTCGVTNIAQLRELLDISVRGIQTTRVQLVNNGLGTGRGLLPTCLQHDGSLWPGERLVIKPGTSLTSDFVAASVNIESANGASLAWSAASGADSVGSGTAPLPPESDTNNNSVVDIEPAATFDSLTLAEAGMAAWNSWIALENGGDSNDGTPTEFFLGTREEYSVNCTDESTVTESGDGSVSTVRFERLPNGYNADKDPTCFKVGATVEIQNDASTEGGELRDVLFVDHTNVAADGTLQEVRANLTIVWRVPRFAADGSLRAGEAIDLELAREIAYGEDLALLQDVEWCGHEVEQPEGFAPEPEHPEGHPWCVVSDDRVVDGDYIVQTQVYHGMGDPKFR